VALFLDEFQTLSNKTVLSFFQGIFERAPDRLKIYIGSRSLPDVDWRGLWLTIAMILRGDDLRFTRRKSNDSSPSQAIWASMAMRLNTIYHRTEGWPAALQHSDLH